MAQKNFADAMNQIVNGTNGLKSQINVKADKHSPALTGTPTAPTPGNDTDSGQIATTEFCQNLIRRLVGSAPETLNTLAELATAINQDPDFAETIVQALDNKLNKTDAASTYLKKTDAASTYATKADLDDIDVDTSNLAKLNTENTFTKGQTIENLTIKKTAVEVIHAQGAGLALATTAKVIGLVCGLESFDKYPSDGSDRTGTLAFGVTNFAETGISWNDTAKTIELFSRYTSVKIDGQNQQVSITPYGVGMSGFAPTVYYFKPDGFYKGSTKIA